ncbi:MAG: FkbM family methyltransferase [Rhizobiaceae bacterium]
MANPPAPFGTHALSPWRESLRRSASLTPSGRLGMWLISLIRKASLMGHPAGMNGPIDVSVADGVNARLFPASNRCEKRAFAGVHIWDETERSALAKRIAAHDQNRPFVFLDIGANVGLYSLFVDATARMQGKKTTIVSVEPDPENRSRLEFNCAASSCAAYIEAIGISDTAGSGNLTIAGINRGGIAITADGDGETVRLETLAELIKRHDLTHVDAMKVDIEGRDEAALRAMVLDLDSDLWPRLLIVETGHDSNSPIVEHLLGSGYQLQDRTKINAILEYGNSGTTANG